MLIGLLNILFCLWLFVWMAASVLIWVMGPYLIVREWRKGKEIA